MSSGVALLSEYSKSLTELAVETPKQFAERFLPMLWYGLVRDGLVAGTVYLISGLKRSEANKEISRHIAEVSKILGIFLILGGDWNMSPKSLQDTGF